MTADSEGGEWSNWSGSLRFSPDEIATPESESELQELVSRSAEVGETVRVVGSGHSSTPIVESEDVLVSLEELSGLVSHDRDATEATLAGGTTLEEAGEELQQVDLAFPNLGDVSLQMVAGAFGTGTHGSGTAYGNLADRLIGGRMVTADGSVREFGVEDDPELLSAARVSLGALGIFTEMRLDLQTAYKLERREYCTTVEDCWEHVDDLTTENRNFDFYWYPRSDEVKLRLLNAPGGGTPHADLEYATLVTRETDWWQEIIPQHNALGRLYDEMEYAVPADVGTECFLEVRDRIREEWRGDVGWRVLFRTVAADDTMLSNEYGRETVTISLLQNAELEFRDYFADIEEIFLGYDGRPHWGKKHSLRAGELAERYPEWDRFQEIRRELDPDGVFLNDYLEALLEDESIDRGDFRRDDDG
ncbi:D-arabinono-1,4-lactone oxidase [Natrarchaeobius sp. A-rgal3]|uniref:D-arabinono-1,4-lactone oxidase n=1 Tax=Natrarchaeobius versutus TaxID=1679078 RepID=UPI00351049EE